MHTLRRVVFSSCLLAAGLPAQSSRASRPAASPALGGRLLVLNKSDANASLLDATTGRELGKIEVGNGPHEAATSPDGRIAVVCNYGDQRPGHTLTVIDLQRGAAEKTIDLKPRRRPHGVAFLPDGKRVVVTAEMDKMLLIVDLEKGTIEDEIETGAETSHMVALGPDGTRAYVANIKSGSMSVIDLAKKELVKVIETGAGCEGIAVHPTRAEVWTANRAADTVSVVDTEKLKVVKVIECAKFPIRVAFTPGGEHALVTCPNSADVAVFATADRSLLRRVALPKRDEDKEGETMFGAQFGQSPVPVGVLVEPEGARAFVAACARDRIEVLDLKRWEFTARFATGRQPDGMTLAK